MVQRSRLVTLLHDKILDSGARFMGNNPKTNAWYELDEFKRKEKIGNKLRDMMKKKTKTNLPTENDIICGRGRAFVNHPGNVKFSQLIKSNVQRYIDETTAVQRGRLVTLLHNEILDSGARFMKTDRKTNIWYELDKSKSKEKIGHALRDMIKGEKSNRSLKLKPSPVTKVDVRKKPGAPNNCFENIHFSTNILDNERIRSKKKLASKNDGNHESESCCPSDLMIQPNDLSNETFADFKF